MTILWSFSYYSFEKFHGDKILEPQHDLLYNKFEPRHEISNTVAFCQKCRLRCACAASF